MSGVRRRLQEGEVQALIDSISIVRSVFSHPSDLHQVLRIEEDYVNIFRNMVYR